MGGRLERHLRYRRQYGDVRSRAAACLPGETVRTSLTSGLLSTDGEGVLPYQWQFTAGPVFERCLGGFANIGARPAGSE